MRNLTFYINTSIIGLAHFCILSNIPFFNVQKLMSRLRE